MVYLNSSDTSSISLIPFLNLEGGTHLISAHLLPWQEGLILSYLILSNLIPHPGRRHDVKSELSVDDGGSGFGEIALVRHQTGSSEAAGTAHLVKIFRPLGVQLTVRFFVLRLENTHRFLMNGKMKTNHNMKANQSSKHECRRLSDMEQ